MEKKSKVESDEKSVWDSCIIKKRNRLVILGGVAVLGLLITPFLVPAIECLLNFIAGLFGDPLFGNSDNKESRDGFRVNLSLLVISLPVLLVLWWFRTYDTREQIKKAEQQIDASIESRETSTRDSQLSTGLQLIADTDVAARCIGLVQLALVRSRCQELEEKLRDQLQGQIDASTQDLVLYKEAKYTSKGEEEEKEEVVKLRGVMLENMDLRGAIMTRAHLEDANLNGVNLEGADLRGAQLIGTNMKGTNLKGAQLTGINLKGTNLKGTNLKGAQLTGINLKGTNLKGTNLKGTRFEGVSFKGTHLEEPI